MSSGGMWQKSLKPSQKTGSRARKGNHQYPLKQQAKEVIKGIEEELIQIHDLEENQTHCTSQYRGRAEGPQVQKIRVDIKAKPGWLQSNNACEEAYVPLRVPRNDIAQGHG